MPGLQVEVDVLANDDDPDGTLARDSLRVVQSPSHGSVRVNADRTVTYTTAGSYQGSDAFRYEVCDAATPRRCATARVEITSAPLGPDHQSPLELVTDGGAPSPY
jgi:hypothetical protein